MQIRHILKLMTDSNTDTVTETFTAIFNKDLKLNYKQARRSVKLKIDSTINSLTAIYNKSLKLY